MAYAAEWGSGINLTALQVPIQQAAVYAAQESSLYLGGQLVPMISVPAGSSTAQVPLMGAATAYTVTNDGAGGSETDPGADITTSLPTNTAKNVLLDLYAARSVIRDLGGVSHEDIGNILGRAVASAYDKAITTIFASLTAQEIPGGQGGMPTVEDIFTAVGTIRGQGETGELFGVVGTNAYGSLMGTIGSAAFAGGEFQTSAMRNGYFGRVAGVPLFVSSYLNDTDMGTSNKNPGVAIMSRDAVKGATQGGLKIEVSRRAASVGWDIVASLAAGVVLVDATRGVIVGDTV